MNQKVDFRRLTNLGSSALVLDLALVILRDFSSVWNHREILILLSLTKGETWSSLRATDLYNGHISEDANLVVIKQLLESKITSII